jgi:hypothetical protein
MLFALGQTVPAWFEVMKIDGSLISEQTGMKAMHPFLRDLSTTSLSTCDLHEPLCAVNGTEQDGGFTVILALLCA